MNVVHHVVLGDRRRDHVPLPDTSNHLYVDVTSESRPDFVFNYYDSVVYGVSKYHYDFKRFYKKISQITVNNVDDVLGKFSRSPYVASDFGMFMFMDYLTKTNATIRLEKYSKVDNGDVEYLITNYLKKINALFEKHLFKPCPFEYERSDVNADGTIDVILSKILRTQRRGQVQKILTKSLY